MMKRSSTNELPSTPPSACKNKLFMTPSPSRKSRKVNLTGYITHIGESRTSQSSHRNQYFDIKFKIAEKEEVKVRCMVLGMPESYLHKRRNQPISLINVSDSNGTLFFNMQTGSSLKELNYGLDFSKELIVTKISGIQEDQCYPINITGTIRWMGENKLSKDGISIREGLLKDETGGIPLTIWKESLINTITEGESYQITHLKLS